MAAAAPAPAPGMGEASSSTFIPTAALSLYPLGPSGTPLIPCPECGDKVIECKSWKNNGRIFFKYVNYNEFAVKKCPFFRWLEDYKKVVAKKLKEDLQAAVPYEGHGDNKDFVEMKVKSRIYDEERMDLKMDKLIGLVQLLVVLCLVIAVVVLLGVVVLISK